MRKILYALTFVAIIALAGCEDTPVDPAEESLIGTWKSSKVGATFPGASEVEIEFKSGGAMTFTSGGMATTGTYSTSGSSGSSGIREISITLPQLAYKGIYQITGNQMKLELVLNPEPSGVEGPDAVSGMGSTTILGAKTNAYITEMQKQ